MTTAIVRLLCAIVISPIVPGVVLWIINTISIGNPSEYFWIWAAAIIGYPILILLALPLLYICLKRDWLTLWHFLGFGGALGGLRFLTPVIVAVASAFAENAPIDVVFLDSVSFVVSKHTIYFLPVCVASGMVAAACFLVITRPSFDTWQRFAQRKGSSERKRWIEAGKTLGRNPDAKVSCPHCKNADLSVTDSHAGNTNTERHMRCPKCGAYNALLIRG